MGDRRRTTLGAAAVLLLLSASLGAQTRDGRFEAGGGLCYTGSILLATVNATETSFGGTSRTVFVSNTSMQSSGGGLVWFAARLMSFLDAEGAVTVSSPGLATAITHDVERAPDTTAREDIRQYSFEGGAAVHPPAWRRLAWSPFLTAGAGHLRQLHEGRVLVETGSLFYAGAGLRYTIHARAAGPKLGVRMDLRAMFMKDGIAFDSALHGTPQFSLSGFVRF